MDGIPVPHLTLSPLTAKVGSSASSESKAKVSYNVNIFLTVQARAKDSHVAEDEVRGGGGATGPVQDRLPGHRQPRAGGEAAYHDTDTQRRVSQPQSHIYILYTPPSYSLLFRWRPANPLGEYRSSPYIEVAMQHYQLDRYRDHVEAAQVEAEQTYRGRGLC